MDAKLVTLIHTFSKFTKKTRISYLLWHCDSFVLCIFVVCKFYCRPLSLHLWAAKIK